MARKNRSLKLLRLARDKKSLIWQKRYLIKLLEQQYHKQNSESLTSDVVSRTKGSIVMDSKVIHI